MTNECDNILLVTTNIITDVLGAIPSHNESPKNIEEICDTIENKINHPKEVVYGITLSTLSFLDLFAVLSCDNNRFKLHGQIPDYFINSLCWYLSSNSKIFSNWNRSGASRDIEISNLLDSPPHFLKLIEEKRMAFSDRHNIKLGHSRVQPVAICLIKTTYKGKVYFLHQWDTDASQYQIIGGKQRPNEDNIDTAKRELEEEISKHKLVYNRDYEIIKINQTPIESVKVSRTYGALTFYKFYLYSIKFNLNNLILSNIDKWISLDEIKRGTTASNLIIRDPEIYKLFEEQFPGSLENLPDSINHSTVINFWKYIEIKPKFFWLTFDIKKIFIDLFKMTTNQKNYS